MEIISIGSMYKKIMNNVYAYNKGTGEVIKWKGKRMTEKEFR